VVLLDTPGFDDTFRRDGEILKNIADWLAISYAGGRQLTAILYLHRITDPRMSGSNMRNLVMFRKLIGDDLLRNVVLVTTMWDSIGQVQGAEREGALLATPDFWGIMVRNGSSVARFGGTKEGACSIIESQLSKTKSTLNIQREMIDDGLQLKDTEAGKEVFAEMTEVKLEHQREIMQLRSDMEAALSQADRAASKTIAKMSEGYDDKLANAQAQIDALQSRNPEMEALQIRHAQEMQNLKDSLEDRMRFLEERESTPPPAYAEAGMISDEDVRDPAQSSISHNRNTSRTIILHLWTLIICFGRLVRILFRPRVPAGYRRLEWTCVCLVFTSQVPC
jgi:ParB-like chromosome segregation protein Spo0J